MTDDGRRRRLEALRDRFVAVNMRSRTLRLLRPSKSGALDLSRVEDAKRLLWLVQVLGSDTARPGILADVASAATGDSLSADVATLAHAARADRMETGADDLAVGWPFLEGRAADGTWLRAPLFLYPVALGQTKKGRLRWTIEPIGSPVLNEPLVQTLARLGGVRVTVEDFLKRDDDGRFKVDDATWKGLLETLQVAGVRLHETPPALPALEPLEPRDAEQRDAAPLDRFKLRFHLVLGRFPAAASTIVQEYDTLLAGPLRDGSLGLAADLLAIDEDAVWEPGAGPPPPAPPLPGHGDDALGDLRRWQPLRSDASQDDVFRFLEKGGRAGLVVQGPPGTGKSQLITNLVAASVARGDRVLLVCQKRAALDVVADRLAHLGLSDVAAIVHDTERDRNAVCHAVADTLAHVLDDSASDGRARREDIERASAAHARALSQVEARVEAHQAAWSLLAAPHHGRPGLAELDQRSLDDPGHPLPDLRDQVASLDEPGLERALPHLDGLAPVAARLARPHPLWRRSDWRDHRQSHLDDAWAKLRTLADALAAWRAVRDTGHLRPRDLDALAATFIEGEPFVRLALDPDDAPLADFVLFWGWCGGDEESGEWARITHQLAEAKARLGPVPSELVVRSDAELDADAERMDELAAIDDHWYRVFRPRYWSLRGLLKRTVEGLSRPVELGDDRPTALANLLREALPWQALIRSMPADSPFFDFGFSGDPAELDQALDHVGGRRDAVGAVHRLAGRLARFRGPYAELPRFDGDVAAARAAPFVAALTADVRRQRALDAVDRALDALAPHLDSPARRDLADAARDDTDRALADVDALLGARGDADAAVALDRQLADQPPWVAAFLKRWRQADAQGTPQQEARRAVEWAWRQLLLSGRPQSALVAPLVEPAGLAALSDAADGSRELTASGIAARYQARLIELAASEHGRQGLQKLAADARKRRYRATLRQVIERHWQRGLAVARPVWLCSPESVAALFPLEPELFDLVIFDEASQCPVESAVPALVRTQRAVIAGDDQQMPPSHFFRAAYDDDLDDEETSLLASQSILDLARIALPNTTLRWHYRCRHEELIAFSNAAFYGRRLATAPNAERRRLASWEGLHFERVDGQWLDQENPVEAELVVDALGRVLGEDAPGGGAPSVGIVTFNKKQAARIEELIEARAALDEAFRERLQRDRERPVIDQVFVRNLENVQGDERDVILMSLGYGPSEPGGRVHARFGPLGQEGGDKRLNVAITRARLGLWVFASFDPEALSVDGSKHAGPKLLKAYMRFVRAASRRDEADADACLTEAAELGGGRGVTARGGRLLGGGRTGLAVRDALAAALIERGYRVKREVGLGRLSLDLAVATHEDRTFRVGVDCSAFLRESDPLTRDLYVPLFWQRLGWTLIRVTPGRWRDERDRVLAAIDEAVDAASA